MGCKSLGHLSGPTGRMVKVSVRGLGCGAQVKLHQVTSKSWKGSHPLY